MNSRWIIFGITLGITLGILGRDVNAQTPVLPGAVIPCPSGTADRCFAQGGQYFNVGIIPTVSNSAYAAGQSLGGLQTIQIGQSAHITGEMSRFGVESQSGSTVAVVYYVWDARPVNTTCVDKTNFVVSMTDNTHLVSGPNQINPGPLGAFDTHTYGSANGSPTWRFNISSGNQLFLCVVANAAVTPPTVNDYRFQIQGMKDLP